ncbi:hypothetical protein M0R04_13720 [Candidatus Dojkabacteria bacterium]|jgi:hypothetical protein|nr:hypothetical protein [Candidatus Dojkabacteria bacterium]
MKKKTIKLIQKLIDEKYLTDWEFIVNVVAPKVEEEEFDVDEICLMVQKAKMLRELENKQYEII